MPPKKKQRTTTESPSTTIESHASSDNQALNDADMAYLFPDDLDLSEFLDIAPNDSVENNGGEALSQAIRETTTQLVNSLISASHHIDEVTIPPLRKAAARQKDSPVFPDLVKPLKRARANLLLLAQHIQALLPELNGNQFLPAHTIKDVDTMQTCLDNSFATMAGCVTDQQLSDIQDCWAHHTRLHALYTELKEQIKHNGEVIPVTVPPHIQNAIPQIKQTATLNIERHQRKLREIEQHEKVTTNVSSAFFQPTPPQSSATVTQPSHDKLKEQQKKASTSTKSSAQNNMLRLIEKCKTIKTTQQNDGSELLTLTSEQVKELGYPTLDSIKRQLPRYFMSHSINHHPSGNSITVFPLHKALISQGCKLPLQDPLNCLFDLLLSGKLTRRTPSKNTATAGLYTRSFSSTTTEEQSLTFDNT